MSLIAILAQLSCSDLEKSIDWFTTVFERGPDARPMEGLAEWHHDNSAGFQLFQNPQHAGHGTLILVVKEVRAEHARLSSAGINPGAVEPASKTTLVRLNDPDGNLVVLAQPSAAPK